MLLVRGDTQAICPWRKRQLFQACCVSNTLKRCLHRSKIATYVSSGSMAPNPALGALATNIRSPRIPDAGRRIGCPPASPSEEQSAFLPRPAPNFLEVGASRGANTKTPVAYAGDDAFEQGAQPPDS